MNPSSMPQGGLEITGIPTSDAKAGIANPGSRVDHANSARDRETYGASAEDARADMPSAIEWMVSASRVPPVRSTSVP